MYLDLLAAHVAKPKPDLAACYDLLSPRLQSALLDAACFAEGLDAAVAEAIWGLSCKEVVSTLQRLGLLEDQQQAPDSPPCLIVPEVIRKSTLQLADQAWARRIVPPDDALAVLDFSKVISGHLLRRHRQVEHDGSQKV